jgi:hypothetical protein
MMLDVARDEIEGGSRVGYMLAAYGSWIVASALAAVIAALWHYSATNTYIELRWNKWAFQFFANVVTLVLGIAWLMVVVFLEHWFTHADTFARLRRRAGRFMIGQAGILAVSYAVATFLVTRHV